VIGRWKVWLAGAKVGDVHTAGLEFFGFADDRRGGRDLNAVDAIGKLHFFSYVFPAASAAAIMNEFGGRRLAPKWQPGKLGNFLAQLLFHHCGH
jgi:hypothetical protein